MTRSDHPHQQQVDELDHALDRLLQGDHSGVESLPEEMEATVSRLFWLSQEAEPHSGLKRQSPRSTSGQHAIDSVDWKLQKRPATASFPLSAPISHRRAQAAGQGHRWHWTGILAAAALLIVVGASAFIYRDLANEGTEPTSTDVIRHAAQPLTNTPSPLVAETLPGDVGNANAYPASIDVSATYFAEPFGNPQMVAAYGMVIDDSLLFVGRPLDSDPQNTPLKLYRQDLASGELRWGVDLYLPERFATDGSTLFALTYEMWPPSAAEAPLLTAIDLVDGAVLWRSLPLAEYADAPRPQAPILPSEPVAINGDVYVALDDGTVISFDGATGEVLWKYIGGTDLAGDAPSPTGNLVANQDHLFAVMPDSTVVKLDRRSGTYLDSFIVGGRDERWASITLHLQGTRLVALANVFQNDDQHMMRLAVFDRDSGAPMWSVLVAAVPGEIVVTPSTIGLPQVRQVERPLLLQLIPGIADTTDQLWTVLLDLETGEELASLDADRNIGWLPVSGTEDVICTGDTSVVCMDRTGATTVIQSAVVSKHSTSPIKPLFHNDRLILIGPEIPIQVAAPAP